MGLTAQMSGESLRWVLVIGLLPLTGPLNTILTMVFFQGSILWGLFFSFGGALRVIRWIDYMVPTPRAEVPESLAASWLCWLAPSIDGGQIQRL